MSHAEEKTLLGSKSNHQEDQPCSNKPDSLELPVASAYSNAVSVTDLLQKLVGSACIVTCKLEGTPARLLADSGSMVTTISEQFFNKHLRNRVENPKDSSHFLKLRAANGLPCPYSGYVIIPIEILGKVVHKGVLVQKDNPNGYDGLLGTNVLDELEEFRKWRQTMMASDGPHNTSSSTPIRVAGQEKIRLPAQSMVDVVATGPASKEPVLVEPLDHPVCGSAAVISTLTKPENGEYIVRVANISKSDIWLRPRMMIGNAQKVDYTLDRILDFREDEGELVIGEIAQVEVEPAHQDKEVKWIEDLLDRNHCQPRLKPSEYSQLKSLLSEFQDVFARDEQDLGCTSATQHRIHLEDERPVKVPHRRIPAAFVQEVKDHIQKLLQQGVIRESSSPYSSAVVLARKKSGQLRLCVDYRLLNRKTRKDSFPLPRIDEYLDSLSGAKLFTTLDLKSAYAQVPIAEEDKFKTAFSTPMGLFEYNRMPYGLCNSPATFQRLMMNIFRKELMDQLLIFLDDILIFSNDFEQHLARLRTVFAKLRSHNLKIEPSKCHLFKKEVRYLGHVISEEGISTDQDKVRAILEWPEPKNPSELLTFLCTAGYYRKFIPNFSQRSAVLYQLVKNDPNKGKKKKPGKKWNSKDPVPWSWTPACSESFQDLKNALTTAPVLGFSDFTKPYVLETDASSQGLGAVLSQWQDGKLRVIGYASRALKGAERNHVRYSSMKLELLALKWAVTEKFRDFLLGTKFTVFTDNNPLKFIMSTAKLKAVEQKWVSELSRFNFEIRYRPGKANGNADALSRKPQQVSNDEDSDMEEDEVAALFGLTAIPQELQDIDCARNTGGSVNILSVDFMTSFPSLTRQELRKLQEEDPVLSRVLHYVKLGEKPKLGRKSSEPKDVHLILKHIQKLELIEGLAYRKIKDPKTHKQIFQVLLPSCQKDRILESLHDSTGHQGMDRTESLVRQRCFWPRMQTDVKNWVNNCNRCTLAKPPSREIRTPMVGLSASRPLEVVSVDFTLLEPSSNGIENILVMTDVFTKFAVAAPTRNQTASTTAKILVKEWFLRYGIPDRIHSDQGRNFEAKLVKQLYKLYSVQSSHTTRYYPKGNGLCERYNKTLHNLLSTLEPEQKRKWPEYIQTVVAYYNATPHPATGYAPFYLMFGRNARLPTDFLLGTLEDEPEDWVKDHKAHLELAHQKANENLQQDKERRKAHYDIKAKDWTIETGTKVYTIDRKRVGRNKIGDHFSPEIYMVLDHKDNVYAIRRADGKGQIIHVNRKELRPIPPNVTPEQPPTVAKERKKPQHQSEDDGPEPHSEESRRNSSSSSDGSDHWLELRAIPLRRSTRQGRGTNSNPYNLPRSVNRQ